MRVAEHPDSSPGRLIMTADFSAPPGRLFEYWTKADLLTQWWSEEADVANGLYHLGWPKLGRTLLGRVTAREPGQKLGFTWTWSHEPLLPERRVFLHFEPMRRGTRIRLEHGPYGDHEAEREDRQSHVEGWHFFLPRLQACLELEGVAYERAQVTALRRG